MQSRTSNLTLEEQAKYWRDMNTWITTCANEIASQYKDRMGVKKKHLTIAEGLAASVQNEQRGTLEGFNLMLGDNNLNSLIIKQGKGILTAEENKRKLELAVETNKLAFQKSLSFLIGKLDSKVESKPGLINLPTRLQKFDSLNNINSHFKLTKKGLIDKLNGEKDDHHFLRMIAQLAKEVFEVHPELNPGYPFKMLNSQYQFPEMPTLKSSNTLQPQ